MAVMFLSEHNRAGRAMAHPTSCSSSGVLKRNKGPGSVLKKDGLRDMAHPASYSPARTMPRRKLRQAYCNRKQQGALTRSRSMGTPVLRMRECCEGLMKPAQ